MAISFVRQTSSTSVNNPILVTNGGAVVAGDLLVAMVGWPVSTSNHQPTFTDNVNAGAWNAPSQIHLYTTQGTGGVVEIAVGWIQCDTPGTPTVTATNVFTDSKNIHLGQYTGFVNTATLVTTDISANQNTSTSPAGSLINSLSNELTIAFGCCAGAQNFTAVTGNFSLRNNGRAGTYYGDSIQSGAGNTLSFGSTITSAAWGTLLFSFQDLGPVPPQGPMPKCVYILP